MTNVTIKAVHHIQITVTRDQEAAARAFYCGLLGLPEIEKPESMKPRGGFWVRLPNADVHIGVEEGVDRTRTKAHIAYLVDDLDAWIERLRGAGIGLRLELPLYPGYRRIQFRDPFGNLIEMLMQTGYTSDD
jgi:catechol 2,3-dioxygenase-like lactoylglutathione lyase family enzyme